MTDIDTATSTDPEDKIVNFDIGRDDDEDNDVDDKVKRGRGRPRKIRMPLDAAPAAQTASDEPAEDRKAKTQKIMIIERLQKQLGAVGTGMRPTMFNSIQELDDEIEALNSDLNVKRGDKAVKSMTLMIMPIIEMMADKFAPKDKLDLSSFRHLKDEVNDNWEMFEEAATHIAILNSGWFAVTPYHEFVSATYACALSVNAKNQAIKKRSGAAIPPVPHNSPDDDNDNDVDTESQ